jgi:hypothetical protein
MVAQLVKAFLCLLWNQLVHYLTQKTSSLAATLNYMNPVHTFPFLRLFFIYSKFSFLFGFFKKILCVLLFSLIQVTRTAYLIFFYLITEIMFG